MKTAAQMLLEITPCLSDFMAPIGAAKALLLLPILCCSKAKGFTLNLQRKITQEHLTNLAENLSLFLAFFA